MTTDTPTPDSTEPGVTDAAGRAAFVRVVVERPEWMSVISYWDHLPASEAPTGGEAPDEPR
jgi:hypothetical protein